MSTTGRAIAILGAKGGVGTTTVASNLAAELANGGSRSVLLLDLNLFLGDVGLHVGVEREPTVMTWMSAENPGDAKRNIPKHTLGFWVLGLAPDLSDADAVEADAAARGAALDGPEPHQHVVPALPCKTTTSLF